jgi:putative hydrolase of the HAD superfamily
MIKAAIFDLGSVLIGKEWQVTYKQIAKELKISEEKTRNIIRPIERKWIKGEINERDFWRELEKRTKTEMSHMIRKDLWFSDMQRFAKDITESWKILTELKTQGIRLALITNTIPPHTRALKKTGRFNKLKRIGFEFFIRSYEVGFRKPGLMIYKIALKKLKLSPEECVFIDDKLKNVDAAKKLCMHGILFKNPKQLRNNLIKLGLI